jgi:hypothetical protein
LADRDGVRVLPGPAGHVQWLSDAVGRPGHLGWRDIRQHLHPDSALDRRGDLPPSVSGYRPCLGSGNEIVAGGTFGAFIVVGLAFVAPKLGPTQTFLVYFFVVAVTSTLIDGFSLLGTEAQPLQARQLVGVLLAGVGLVLARS